RFPPCFVAASVRLAAHSTTFRRAHWSPQQARAHSFFLLWLCRQTGPMAYAKSTFQTCTSARKNYPPQWKTPRHSCLDCSSSGHLIGAPARDTCSFHLFSSSLLKKAFRRHSERSEESLFDQNAKKREIPHFADSVRNDRYGVFQQPAKTPLPKNPPPGSPTPIPTPNPAAPRARARSAWPPPISRSKRSSPPSSVPAEIPAPQSPGSLSG